MQTVMLHINGYPGTGKLTTAKELCRLEGFRLIDNHAMSNLLLSFAKADNTPHGTKEMWELKEKFRSTIMDEFDKSAIPDANFVFTNCLYHGDDYSLQASSRIILSAERRNSIYVPINLSCDISENLRRITSPERDANMKLTDPNQLRRVYERRLLKPQSPYFLELDVTDLKPKQSAQIIHKHISLSAP